MTYIGRFAPSPSGRLHLGSATIAIASYLRAKQQYGKIILRIEDLDKTRCSFENTKAIFKELDSLGLKYDEIFIQSEHDKDYLYVINKLLQQEIAYICKCSRKEIQKRPCPCKDKHFKAEGHYSIRFPLSYKRTNFNDTILGNINLDRKLDSIILKRADDMISYNLACCYDDIRENITEIVRGADLLYATFMQFDLLDTLNYQKKNLPSYLHIPLVLDENNNKYSKQNHAKAIFDSYSVNDIIKLCLTHLNQDTSYITKNKSSKEIILKAIDNFDISKIGTTNRQIIY